MLVTDIVVFYLVLRGLDTVEDDMTAFDDMQVHVAPIIGLCRVHLSSARKENRGNFCVSTECWSPFHDCPLFSCQVKIKYLTEFHETALVDREWKLEGVGEGDERVLLERFSSVTTVFQSLSEGSQEVCT